MGQDKVKFGRDEEGNLKMTVFDEKDHHDVGNPHAHDVDMSHPFDDFNGARGDARPITDDERREYYPNSS